MRLFIIVTTTIFVFSLIYAPQPLLPLFSHNFLATESEAALLITATMLPLALAPLSYGYILETLSSLKLLRGAVLALALSEIAFASANSFTLLVGLRFLQGLFVPAALTSMMTYISTSTQGMRLQQGLSLYIASGMLGSVFGRLLAGLFATYLDWRLFFLILGLLLLVAFLTLGYLEDQAQVVTTKPKLRILGDTLQKGDYVKVYLIVFCLFFVFAAFFNFLPFRLKTIWPAVSESVTGLMYTCYMFGLITSLGSGKLITLLRGEVNTMLAGQSFFIAALALTLVSDITLLFVAMSIFCLAMFLVHSVGAGLVNKMAAQNKGIVNGLYVTFYYGGGVAGSYLPGLIYERFGWQVFITTLLIVTGIGLATILVYKLRPSHKIVASGEAH